MKIDIKSTSYLLPKNASWNTLRKNNKLIFSEYNNIFSNPKFNNKIECEIFVLFFKDIIDYYKVKEKVIKNEHKKIQLIIKLIKDKISIYKKKTL